jgi:hypothetical protein
MPIQRVPEYFVRAAHGCFIRPGTAPGSILVESESGHIMIWSNLIPPMTDHVMLRLISAPNDRDGRAGQTTLGHLSSEFAEGAHFFPQMTRMIQIVAFGCMPAFICAFCVIR